MTPANTTKVAATLLQERSRDALIQGLMKAMESLEPDEAVAFLADLLLAVGADRDQLKARLTTLLATKFGRRSEKATNAQLQLFAEALRRVAGDRTSPIPSADDEQAPSPEPGETAAELIERTNAEIKAEVTARREQRRAEREERRAQQRADKARGSKPVTWPTNLPVREEVLPVSDAEQICEVCGKERRVIRHETSWRIEYKTTAEVVVTKLPVLACPGHDSVPTVQPVPPKPVDHGSMGFSLAAWLLWLRLTHNLPARRLAEMMKAEGVPVSEDMIHTLIRVSGERAKPLSEAIHRAVQATALVNMDDTPVTVLDDQPEGGRKPRKARVWLALGGALFAWFFATRTWQEKEVKKALGPIEGTLQGDGYKGFPKYSKSEGIPLAGCMAHLRRKFLKALRAHDPRAVEPMALINGLYRIEELGRLKGLDAEALLALRQERSVPIWRALIAWAKIVQPTIETGSPLGQAWTYLSNQREQLEVFLHDGNVSIDNLAAERGLRRITIGRHLWLFFRDQDKLDHVARLMSIVTTARLHGVDELAYLEWVLERLATREWSVEAAKKLLPSAWLELQEKPAEEDRT